jgi:integrase
MFYFRRRVPDDLRLIVGKPYLVKSLRTGRRREAIILARAYAACTDRYFTELRNMASNQNNDDTIRIDFGFELEWDELGKPRKLKVTEAQPHEAEALNSAIETTLRNLPQPASAAPAPPQKSSKTIGETWNDYKAEKIATNSWKDGEDTAKYDYWPPIRDLIDLIGNKTIGAVTAEDVERFQHFVLIDNPEESPSNKNKRLTRAGALFRWAKTKRRITDPFSELFRYPGDIPRNSYLKFEVSDLVSLFESDEYRRHRFKTPSGYWLPVLGLFTGARLNELCQLTRSDIGAYDGVPTISILDEEIGKRLKTAASRRIVPIHSKLIDLGFLDYVSTITSGRIFPELPENPVKAGDFSKEPGRRFTAYRRRMGVGEMESRSKKVFHSFRSTLISALRKANVPKDRRTRLAGHEYDDTQDQHYDGGDALTMFDFAILKGDIELVRYDVAFTPYSPTAPASGPRRGRKPTGTA